MVGKQTGVALVLAAQAGVVTAQEADDPVLIPPAPAAVEQEGAADDVDAGPALIPAVPVSPSSNDEGPALGEPAVPPEPVAPVEESESDLPEPEPVPETDLDGPTADDPLPAAPRRTRVPPARPAPASYPEERAESGEVRIRQRGTERREEVPPVAERDSAPVVESREEGVAEVAEDVRSRYRLAGGEWWFLTRSGRWKYYRGGEWREFDPVTFVPLRALQERGEAGVRPYAALRPVSPVGGEEEEDGDEPPIPPGYRLVPADAVDVRAGTYYGPGPEGYAEPVPEEGRERRRPLRSMIRGFFGR